MARTNKSLVSDFIKGMLFDEGKLTKVADIKLSNKINKVFDESPHWKSVTITTDNKKSISDNIKLQVKVGDTVAFNNNPIQVKKPNSLNGCTIVANVKRGKLISVTQPKKKMQLLYVL